MRFLRPAAIILLVLGLDQWLKLWIKLNFHYNESLKITEWFYLYFIENEGMAFGMTWGGESGKLMLTLFRLIAGIIIIFVLVNLINRKAHPGLVISVALIFAGAAGNLIDSVFYGKIFSVSTPSTKAILFPPEGGYSPLLHGRVVDMLYFPLFEGFLPEWMPYWGGDYFIFFRPIFNIADASITTGVISIIVFQKKFFKEKKTETTSEPGSLPDSSGQTERKEFTS